MANGPSNTQLNQKARPGTLSAILPAPATSSTLNSQLRSRVTRSAARLAAESAAISTPSHSTPGPRSSNPSKKRKGPHRESSPVEEPSGSSPLSPPRKAKRQKVSNTNSPPSQATLARSSRRTKPPPDTAMSNNGSSSKYTDESSKISSKSNSKRPASRNNKKPAQDNSTSTQTSSVRKPKKRLAKKDVEMAMKSDDETPSKSSRKHNESSSPPIPLPNSDSNDGESPTGMDDEDGGNDPFSAALFGSGRGPSSGLSNTLRALSGMMSGMSSRLRDILNNLRQVDNPTMQLVALEELSNLLLVSNEDNLSGQFSPDPYIKELVSLMQPNPLTGEENPEMMLLACRCIANLMEALRGSVANVVYGGAVPVLCQKLLDIQYIDVAEQALSTLSKISIDFPASIVREGGLTACLQFLDFFATGTQRTAVTTAANCCRNIPHDSFPVIRDVMPILQNVLVSHDQKVVEQGCLCVTRVIDSFKRSSEKLEQLVDPALLRAVLGLLLPGTTNLIGSNIHTEFLRVLAIVAKASPKLSAEMLRMNIVDTLYQILTGVSPPSETSDAASKIDSVVIMQALIHRPREQVYETLNVICELLPKARNTSYNGGTDDDLNESGSDDSNTSDNRASRTAKRLELLKECQQESRRFAMILLPTLTDAYSSTVNLSVRQKVLTAQLKILSNLHVAVIEEALRPVPYASFLASILSQEDHPSLVMFALQASELLFDRLEDIYQYQFHREGVISEIKKIADRQPEAEVGVEASTNTGKVDQSNIQSSSGDKSSLHEQAIDEKAEATSNENQDLVDDDDEDHEGADDDDDENDEEHDGGDIVVRDDHDMDDSHSSDSSDEDIPLSITISGANDLVIVKAKKFLEKYENSKGRELKAKAGKIRQDLQALANDIEAYYYDGKTNQEGQQLFSRLANYFDGDALESITSSELLDSGIIRVLNMVLVGESTLSTITVNPRGDFLAQFMGTTTSAKVKTTTATSSSTPFSILIQKLQDLLSRAEHFEVLTVNNNASENNRMSSTSMLSRQLRLRLSADSDSDIPPSYREMIVSIHAIATFKALDDYLRPRFSLSERPPSASRRREMLQQLATARMAQLSGAAESRLFSPFGQELSSLSPQVGSGDSRPGSRFASHGKPSGLERSARGEVPSTENNERRRSLRKTQPLSSAVNPSRPPEPSSENAEATLECADEKVIDDEKEESALVEGTPEAFIAGLEEEVSDEDDSEPGAVNLEVASSGKVTARQDDGTRIFTPLPGTPVSGAARPPPPPGQSPGLSALTSGLPNSGRPSYAAALASVPQDWHIEFSIDGKVIPNHTTIYRAVHHNRDQSQDLTLKTVWSGVHAVKFKRVKGPPPTQSSLDNFTAEKIEDSGNLPLSLDGHPVTSSILSLLRILHELNASLEDVRDTLGRTGLRLYAEPLASFINTKLTAKMNRQLEEPLIVASNCLPDWSEDLARSFPFLFPFETRHLFLQSTSFGYSRSMVRWQNNQAETDDRRDRRRDDRPMMGRPQRQKVRISRSRILESAMKVMEMYGASPSVLEVEYFEEVGTGLGPTLEFYSTVSKEFSKKKLKMWRENDTVGGAEFAFGKNGLFPIPMSSKEAEAENGKKLLYFFKMLGKFVARSMLDSRIIDISFSSTFFKLASNPSMSLSIGLLRTIDQDLANSLLHLQQFANAKANINSESGITDKQKAQRLSNLTVTGAHIDDLMVDFTLPGYPDIELIENGKDTLVSIDNVDRYIEQVLDLSLGSGVQRQIEAFQVGFSQIFSFTSLRAFTANELVMLFGRVEEDWSIETLMDSVKADHGFNMDSKSVKNLLQTMSELTPEQRRDFLQFVTGSPKLPIGGFRSLTPMFTVVCKPSEPPYSSDDYLPSVMTCVNYLKLPDYSTQEVLKERLGLAIREGQGAFHLS